MALGATVQQGLARPQFYGITLGLQPGREPDGRTWLRETEIERAPDSGGSPDTGNALTIRVLGPMPAGGMVVTDARPSAAVYWHYRARHIGRGYDAGAWSAWVKAKPRLLYAEAKDMLDTSGVGVYPLRREMPMTDGAHAVKGVDEQGELMHQNVLQTDGVANRVLAKGHQTGQGRNGDAVTFSPSFQHAPLVLLRGGISYEPRSGQWSPSFDSTKPQYDDLVPLNPTAAGFTIRARLKQKGAQTAQADDFPASNDIDAVGETTEANLDPAGAAGDQYAINFDVRLRTVCQVEGKPIVTVTVVVALDTNDGSGWVERTTRSFQGDAESGTECSGLGYTEYLFDDEVFSVTVSGLGLNDDVRLRVKSITNPSFINDLLVHGHRAADDGTAGVVYTTATDAFADKTPDSEDAVLWEAIEVS